VTFNQSLWQLPNCSFNYVSINGWIHWLDQNPHDPVTSQKPHPCGEPF
jgi:hypothetical protein